MNSNTQVSLLLLCLKIALTWGYNADELYSIHVVGSNNLVLDAADPDSVKIEYFNGYSTQLWKITIGSRPGLFYIINNHEKKALDIKKTTTPIYHVLMVNPKSNSMDQQWFIHADGRIVNAAKPTDSITPYAHKYEPGNLMQLWNDPNNVHKFVLKKKV